MFDGYLFQAKNITSCRYSWQHFFYADISLEIGKSPDYKNAWSTVPYSQQEQVHIHGSESSTTNHLLLIDYIYRNERMFEQQ